MTDELPSRAEAIELLEGGRAATDALLERVPRNRWSTPGLGGGDWSPKDLIGHLASWEGFALEALEAWHHGERAEIDRLWFSVPTSRVNAENVERKAAWPPAKARREAARTHLALVDTIRSMPDERWENPASKRARKPVGIRIGNILGGPKGMFRHDEAHHRSIETFLEALRR